MKKINEMTQAELKDFFNKEYDKINELQILYNIESHKRKLTIQEKMVSDLLSHIRSAIYEQIQSFDINYNHYQNTKGLPEQIESIIELLKKD